MANGYRAICVGFALATAGISLALPASAQWVTSVNGGDFDDDPLRLAVTMSGNYAIGVRCRNNDAEIVYATPDKSMDDPDLLKITNATEPLLKYRIDGKEVYELNAEIDSQETGMAAIAKITLDDMTRLRDARKSLSVVIRIMGKNFHETRFGSSGSTKAMNELIDGCKMAQSPSLADDEEDVEADSDGLSYNEASFEDARDALERYYRESIYPDARCVTKDVAGKTFAFCRPGVAARIGGLFMLRKDPEGTSIFAVNGKAKDHIGPSETLRVKAGLSPVVMLHDASIDIPEVLKAFR